MTSPQLVAIAISFIILLLITLAAQFKWLPRGRAKGILIFLAGVASIFFLYTAGLPPWWFEGEWEAFALAGSLLLSAWVLKTADERAFGRPLLGGMGLTLIALNLFEAARNVL